MSKNTTADLLGTLMIVCQNYVKRLAWRAVDEENADNPFTNINDALADEFARYLDEFERDKQKKLC